MKKGKKRRKLWWWVLGVFAFGALYVSLTNWTVLSGADGRIFTGVVDQDVTDLNGRVAIPRGSKHASDAWLLIKFLATDTAAEVHLTNVLRNLPVTNASLQTPDILPDPNFKTFFPIFSNRSDIRRVLGA